METQTALESESFASKLGTTKLGAAEHLESVLFNLEVQLVAQSKVSSFTKSIVYVALA